MRRLAVLLVLCALGLAAAPASAAAHPLGNFTVNHFNGLTLFPDRIDLHAVIDLAEIPAVQERPTVDRDGDGTVSPAEADRYAGRECWRFATATTVAVDGRSGEWRPAGHRLEFPAGEAGLATMRLLCEFTTSATLDHPATIDFRDAFRTDRIGWHELVVTGDGVRTVDSALPATSVSDELRAYPEDLLADPLDLRAATFRTEPGAAGSGAALGAPPGSVVTSATSWFTDLAGSRDLTPIVGLLAVLLSLVLGASHAALPGHGKTVIAAYLAGKNGSVRDAVTVGATVTVTHTAGVLVLGLLISGSSAVAGESVLGWLGVASGLLVALIGAVLLRSALRARARAMPAAPVREPVLAHTGGPSPHAQHHGHGHAHGHSHGHGHGHGHSHGYGRTGLIGMGVAGGLVPSPSALVVLLGAIALGRTWFGVLLVVGYGVGMAATLTLVGVLLVRFRDRFERLPRLQNRLTRLRNWMPALTATLVLVVGLGLAVRAAAGIT
ncbi:MAG: High-affinity nickel-transporter [Actinophytocola sp.]|uniref:nickel/cobalt transporter n=1 Tax=Actinophytocola sp. TaxID=1872138 RepID=UPI003C771B02